MRPDNSLISNESGYCMAIKGQIYVIYLGEGGTTELRLPDATFAVSWYDPRKGGNVQSGSVEQIKGGGSRSIGAPPVDDKKDWVALVRLSESTPNPSSQLSE
jgi:hypothetical protein